MPQRATPTGSAQGARSKTASPAPSVRFTCPHCRAYLKAAAARAGSLISCAACKRQVEVPGIEQERVAEPDDRAAEIVKPARRPPRLRVTQWANHSFAKKLPLDRRKRALVLSSGAAGVLLVLMVLIVWLDPTRVLIGKLAGDPFYDGRPLRYWVAGLGDKLPSKRLDAVHTLGKMGPAAKAAVPALARMLEDPDAGVRGVTAMTLGDLGPDAGAAIPALRNALLDREPFIRRAAQEALKRIDSQASPK